MNFSKSGVSFSVGAPGSWLTLGKRGVRTTLGLSGTGLSWYQQTPCPKQAPPAAPPALLPAAPQPLHAGRLTIIVVVMAIAAFLALMAMTLGGG